MQHSQRILTIFKDFDISAYKISKDTGISESLFSKWKINPTSEISSKNLVKIADYLGVSIDYLLGRSASPEVHDPIFKTVHGTTTTCNLDHKRNQVTQNN